VNANPKSPNCQPRRPAKTSRRSDMTEPSAPSSTASPTATRGSTSQLAEDRLQAAADRLRAENLRHKLGEPSKLGESLPSRSTFQSSSVHVRGLEEARAATHRLTVARLLRESGAPERHVGADRERRCDAW